MLFFLPLKNTKTTFLFTISALVLNYVVFLISEFIIIPYQNNKKINTIYSKNPVMKKYIVYFFITNLIYYILYII